MKEICKTEWNALTNICISVYIYIYRYYTHIKAENASRTT